MIYWLLIALIFIFGLTIGSFINALEYRIDSELSILKGRSICPKCKKQLKWYENIPVLSFLFLEGKCGHCKEPISWQYPIVELLTGFSFVAGFWKLGVLTDTISIFSHLILYFIFSILILVALHDQKTSYVLSAYVYAAIISVVIYLLVTYTGVWEIKNIWLYLLPNLASALIAASPFAILYIFSKGAWMGAGDIEVAVLLGFLLGWPNFLIALYFAFIVGSLWGIIKVYMLKNAKLKSELPFAPFLIAGTFFAFLFAEQLVSLYVKIFLG